MIIYPSKLDPKYIYSLTKNLKYRIDSTGVLMAWAQGGGLIPGFESFAAEIAQACNRKALHQMINILPPGCNVSEHKDPLIPPNVYLERWHLPIKTNLMSFLSENNRSYWLETGFWHGPLNYWESHSVRNNGSTERVHLIVDLDPRFDYNGNKI